MRNSTEHKKNQNGFMEVALLLIAGLLVLLVGGYALMRMRAAEPLESENPIVQDVTLPKIVEPKTNSNDQNNLTLFEELEVTKPNNWLKLDCEGYAILSPRNDHARECEDRSDVMLVFSNNHSLAGRYAEYSECSPTVEHSVVLKGSSNYDCQVTKHPHHEAVRSSWTTKDGQQHYEYEVFEQEQDLVHVIYLGSESGGKPHLKLFEEVVQSIKFIAEE